MLRYIYACMKWVIYNVYCMFIHKKVENMLNKAYMLAFDMNNVYNVPIQNSRRKIK